MSLADRSRKGSTVTTPSSTALTAGSALEAILTRKGVAPAGATGDSEHLEGVLVDDRAGVATSPMTAWPPGSTRTAGGAAPGAWTPWRSRKKTQS